MNKSTILEAQQAKDHLIKVLQTGDVEFLAVACSPNDGQCTWCLTVLTGNSGYSPSWEKIRAEADKYGVEIAPKPLPLVFTGGDYLMPDRIELTVADNANMLEVVEQLNWLLPRFNLEVVRLVIGEQKMEIAWSAMTSRRDLEQLAQLLQIRQAGATREARIAGYRGRLPAFLKQIRSVIFLLENNPDGGDPAIRYDFDTDSIEVEFGGLSIREKSEETPVENTVAISEGFAINAGPDTPSMGFDLDSGIDIG